MTVIIRDLVCRNLFEKGMRNNEYKNEVHLTIVTMRFITRGDFHFNKRRDFISFLRRLQMFIYDLSNRIVREAAILLVLINTKRMKKCCIIRLDCLYSEVSFNLFFRLRCKITFCYNLSKDVK